MYIVLKGTQDGFLQCKSLPDRYTWLADGMVIVQSAESITARFSDLFALGQMPDLAWIEGEAYSREHPLIVSCHSPLTKLDAPFSLSRDCSLRHDILWVYRYFDQITGTLCGRNRQNMTSNSFIWWHLRQNMFFDPCVAPSKVHHLRRKAQSSQIHPSSSLEQLHQTSPY